MMANRFCKEIDLISSEEIDTFLDSFDTVLCDVDGVLRIGSRAIDGSPEAIQQLRQLGKSIYYVSNSSLQSRKEYLDSLVQKGYEGCVDDMFTPSYSCAQYLKDIGFSKTVYVLGTKAVGEELDEAGIKHIGCGYDPTPERWYDPAVVKDIKETMSDDIGCVIVGMTCDVSYLKLVKAVSYLSDPNILFLGTNMDKKFQLGKGYIVPGDGPFISFIQTATGRSPIVLGKPNKYMFETVKSVHPDVIPSRTLMVGDTPSTDMVFGNVCGLKTLMVGTGNGSLNEIKAFENTTDEETQRYIPDYYVNKLSDLLPHLQRYQRSA